VPVPLLVLATGAVDLLVDARFVSIGINGVSGDDSNESSQSVVGFSQSIMMIVPSIISLACKM
jgi:hypothetical protein